MYTYTLLATVSLSCLAWAQDGKLDKPPLHDNLDYLKPGLQDHLPLTHNTNEPWNGFIPQDCQSMTQDAKLDPKDVTAINVTYDDVRPALTLCTRQQQSCTQRHDANEPHSVAHRGFYVTTKTAPRMPRP